MAPIFEINFNLSDLRRIKRALVAMGTESAVQENELPRLCAEDFKLLLVNNIVTQAFSYPEYSERYEDWKRNTMGISRGFWQLYGDLLNNISTFQTNDGGHVAGIRKGIRDGGGKSWFSTPMDLRGESKEIAAYGREVEKKRPLFKPTFEQYRDGQFVSRGNDALTRIGYPWRRGR